MDIDTIAAVASAFDLQINEHSERFETKVGALNYYRQYVANNKDVKSCKLYAVTEKGKRVFLYTII